MRKLKLKKREAAVKLTSRHTKKKASIKFKNGRMSFSRLSQSKRKTVKSANKSETGLSLLNLT
jgi:hypothetical protein